MASQLVRKEKLHELDYVRSFSILAVLMIHVTADATVMLAVDSLPWRGYVSLNKLSNFAVPAFIILSGIVLFYRYNNDWSLRHLRKPIKLAPETFGS